MQRDKLCNMYCLELVLVVKFIRWDIFVPPAFIGTFAEFGHFFHQMPELLPGPTQARLTNWA